MRILLPAYILFIISLLSVKTYAQHTYIPLPDTGIWVTQVEDWHEGEGPVPHTFYYKVGINRKIDTFVNNYHYSSYFGDRNNWNIPYTQQELMYATGTWFRQDTVAKKVWLVQDKMFPELEKVAYDFSLAEGDTITDPLNLWLGPNDLGPHKAWVDNIDSLYLPDNKWHYRWNMKSNWANINYLDITMIEGIGYTTGLWFNPLAAYQAPILYTYDLICFNAYDQWLFEMPNMWGHDCDSMVDHNTLPVSVSNISNVDMSKPILYPNPVSANQDLYLNSFASDKPCTVKAYNYLGAEIINTKVVPGNNISLSQFGLMAGVYFFSISSEHRLIYKQKIVITE